MKQLLIFLYVLGSSIVFGQQINLVSEMNQDVTIRFTMNDTTVQILKKKDTIDLNSLFRTTLIPDNASPLPFFSTAIQLPNTGSPNIEVLAKNWIEIDSVTLKNTVQQFRSNSSSTKHSSNSFAESSDSTICLLSDPFISRDLRGVNLLFFPIHYNSVTHRLRIYTSIQVLIKTNPSIPGKNELHSIIQPQKTKHFFGTHFLNQPAKTKYSAMSEEGEMLLICPDSLESTILPLVNWKNQKGIKTVVANLSITGGDYQSIHNYLSTYYQNHPDLVYLLLVGDQQEIQAYSYGLSGGEELFSDTYYGQLVGDDFYPELMVGRFSGNTQQIKTMVDRVLEYEKNPAAGNWMTKAIGIASAQGDSIGDDGESDWQHERNLRTQLLNFGYTTVDEFYDGSQGGQDSLGNPTSSMVLNQLNNGVGLINYTGHGDLNAFVTSNFTSSNINQASNHGFYPFVVSVACYNGTFVYGTCLAESWLRASKNGTPTGAIGVCASTVLMPWATPMQTQDEIVNLITSTDSTLQKSTLGGLFYNAQLSMLDAYPTTDGTEVMQTWLLFGDPSCQFRNQLPQALTVSHVTHISESTISVDFICPTENALIGLSQDNQLLSTGKIHNGTLTLNFPMLTTNLPLLVTATKQNYIPYQQLIQVGNGPLNTSDIIPTELLTVYPNPASDFIEITTQLSCNSNLSIVDLTGKTMDSLFLSAGTNSLKLDTKLYARGMYYVRIEHENFQTTQKISLE